MESSEKKTEKQDNQPQKTVMIMGSPLMAETFFKSPYYRPSYDFPWNPDPLCSGNNYDKYDEMRMDDQVKAALTVKKDFVVSTGWQIVCDNPEVKDFVTNVFENINAEGLDSTFDDILHNILTSYDYGFSITEPIYKIENGKYVFNNLVVRPPHSFMFDLDKKGAVYLIVQRTESGDKKFDPNLFLHHVNAKEFSNPYGNSDLRAAYQPWKSKKFMERMYARYVEKFASPTVVGTYPQNFEDSEIREFYDHLSKIQNCTTLAIPEGTTVDFKEINGQGSDIFIAAINHYNMMIARSILIPDLLGISGGEIKGGSYALGSEQFKLFLETIKKDRISLAKKITLKLVRPLVKMNFGDVPCTFDFKPFAKEKDLLTLWTNAVNGKVFKPNKEEVNYFRSSLGFPEGEVEIPEPAPFTVPMRTEKEFEVKTTIKEYKKLGRELTQYEKKVDFEIVNETLVDKAERFAGKLKTPAKDISNSLIEQLRDEVLLKRFNPEKINQIQPKFLKDMNVVLRRYFVDLFKSATNQAQKELFPDKEKKYTEELLPEEFLDLLQSESFKVVGDYSIEITKKAKNILTQGIKNGVPQSEIIKLMREELGETTERWLNTMVRTKTTEIYNEARKRYWESDEYAKQIVEAYQVSAILDDRTSEICERLDKEIISIEDSQRIKPPFHYNCRTILVPITKFEDYKLSDLPSTDKLQELGGNLLMFSADAKSGLNPNWASGTIKTAGDLRIIEPPGDEYQITIDSLEIVNHDTKFAVQVCLKDGDGKVVYPVTLSKDGGRVFREFRGGYKVKKGSWLTINVSTNAEVSYLIEYRVI